jgi:glycosyltransferase involved in cell wall biosynthesis
MIAGPTDEDPQECSKLRSLSRELKISKNIIFIDGVVLEGYQNDDGTYYALKDLATVAKMFWFLPGQLYDSFGEAVGEAPSFKLPICVSGYEAFDQVYGEKGVWALKMDDREVDLPNRALAERVFDIIYNSNKYTQRVEENYARVCKYFSPNKLEQMLKKFDISRNFEQPGLAS